MLCDNVNHSKSQTRPKSIGSLAKWSRSAACGLVWAISTISKHVYETEW